jgi:hypothetical protein
MENLIDRIGGRKLLAALVALIAIGIFVVVKGDVPPAAKDLIMAVFGALVAGNAVEHMTDASIANNQARAAAAPQVAEETVVQEPAQGVTQGVTRDDLVQLYQTLKGDIDAVNNSVKGTNDIIKSLVDTLKDR